MLEHEINTKVTMKHDVFLGIKGLPKSLKNQASGSGKTKFTCCNFMLHLHLTE